MPEPVAARQPPAVRGAGLALVAAGLAAFVTTLDNTVVAVALRDVQRDLGGGVAGLQGVVAAYTVALTALLLGAGTLVDVAGARRVLLSGLAVFGVASAGCALTASVPGLVVLRGVQGAGAALVLPASLAVLVAAHPEAGARGRAVAGWAAAGGLALAAGPLVGGLLVEAYGWRAVFWVNVPLCCLVAAAVLGGAIGQAARTGTPTGGSAATGRLVSRLDLAGQLLLATGLAAVAYGVVLLGRHGAVTPGAGLVVVAGCGCLAAFGLVERRARHPVLAPLLAGDRQFAVALTAAFAASLSVFVLLVFLSLFLQLVQERAALPTALRLLPLTVGLVLAAAPAARWNRRRGPRAPVVAGLLLAAGGTAGLALRLTVTTGAVPLGLLLAVVGVGLGLTTTPVVTASLGLLAASRSGLAAAAVGVARELGGVVAVAGLGALVVARLGSGAAAALTAQGVAPAQARTVTAVLLGGGGVAEVLTATPRLGFGVLLHLTAIFRASYVTSTRLVLTVTATLLALTAALAAAGLSGRPAGRAGAGHAGL